MAEKNIQIKYRNQQGGFDDLYPITKTELVEGLQEELDKKVDKVAGKQLSDENYTATEKSKLAGIEPGANNYVHPSTHPASMITESTTRRFVSDSEKATWNAKEDASNKGKADGYASLDANAKIPLSQLPDVAKNQTFVVANKTEREALTGMLSGDKCYETSTGDSYIYDGSNWQILAKAEWENVNLDWNNIVNAPSSSTANIDDAVSKRHTHPNKSVLDKITDSGSSNYDLAQFVTKSELGDAGYGDMLKSEYDTDGDGKVDRAEVADSVAWSGVTGKPSTFPPSSHTHPASQIEESSSKQFVSNTEKATWNNKTRVVLSSTTPSDSDVDIWLKEV